MAMDTHALQATKFNRYRYSTINLENSFCYLQHARMHMLFLLFNAQNHTLKGTQSEYSIHLLQIEPRQYREQPGLKLTLNTCNIQHELYGDKPYHRKK